MNAAYSVWDERAVLPGNLNAATKTADPKSANERHLIGNGPNVLTRQALSHWARWSASGDHQRVQLRGGIVGQRDADALDQLERNMVDLGPRPEWFPLDAKHHLTMKAGLPDGLMRGLVMDARVLPALLRILNLHSAKEERLEKALRAMERVETLNNRPAASVAAAPPVLIEDKGEDMSALRARVKAQLEERKVDLREPVSEETKRDIADALGVHSATVNRFVVDLRRAAGIEVTTSPTVGAGGTIKERLKAQIEARQIDLMQPVAMTTQEALAITLNTTRATVNGYIVQLRAEARKAAEKARQEPVEQEPVEVPELPLKRDRRVQCHIWSDDPFDNDDVVRCDLDQGHTGPHKRGSKTWPNESEAPPKAATPSPVVAPSTPSDHSLRAEIDTMRLQLQALTSERDTLRRNLAEWTETALENERQRVRWMNQALDLRREFEEFKAQATPVSHLWGLGENSVSCGIAYHDRLQMSHSHRGTTCVECLLMELHRYVLALAKPAIEMARHDAPTVIPVATVPQAITNAEVRELAGYEALGADIGRLVTAKQQQYGDAFGRSGEVLRVLYPDGIKPEQMDDALAVVRITDKLFRIAAGNQGGENAWMDLAGYGLLGAAKGVSN